MKGHRLRAANRQGHNPNPAPHRLDLHTQQTGPDTSVVYRAKYPDSGKSIDIYVPADDLANKLANKAQIEAPDAVVTERLQLQRAGSHYYPWGPPRAEPEPPLQRPMPPEEGPYFAVLADQLLRQLAQPKGLMMETFYEGEVAEAFRDFEAKVMEQPGQYGPRLRAWKTGRAALQRGLREAKKIVFDPDFSALVMETAQQSPAVLRRLLQTARLPYEHCWIEWTEMNSVLLPPGLPLRKGLWITPYAQSPTGAPVYQAAFAWWREDPRIFPGGLRFCLEEAVALDGSSLLATLDLLEPPELGKKLKLLLAKKKFEGEYGERWWPRQRRDMLALGDHWVYQTDLPPLGRRWSEFLHWVYGDESSPDALLHAVGSMIEIVQWQFRELLAGLALMMTHYGGMPVTRASLHKSQPSLVKGHYHAAYEYRVLQLVRPMTAPRLMRHAVPARPRPGPVPLHDVAAAWHHRRAPNPRCQVHPVACLRADWAPVEPDDDDPHAQPERPHTLQACAVCDRRRWWVKEHNRGDATIGVIDKGYEVKRNKRLPSMAAATASARETG